MLKDAFSIFAPTYGSTFKILDCKFDTRKNQCLPFNYDALPLKMLFRDLQLFVMGIGRTCGRAINLFWLHLLLVDFALMLRDVILCSQQSFETGSNALMQSFHEPIIAWQAATTATICLKFILLFASFHGWRCHYLC